MNHIYRAIESPGQVNHGDITEVNLSVVSNFLGSLQTCPCDSHGFADHIDIWNGKKSGSGIYKSIKVWFWEIK